jgi:outer membrane protein assembly factor BamA
LLSLLRLRSGEVFNQRLFDESIDELNKLGRFELIDRDKDTDYRTDVEDALIDIVIKIRNRDPGLSLARQH